jgi:hypothetical protein
MKLGVLFPQTEFGADPVAIREYAQAAEDLGYESLALYEHVVSARPEGRAEQWVSPHHQHMFHEPFVLFGYLAGLTRRLVFVTKALGLPQRQTALVAKQAAEVDVITGGRIRLGVGVGWNSVDFEAMGQEFHTRRRRIEEQTIHPPFHSGFLVDNANDHVGTYGRWLRCRSANARSFTALPRLPPNRRAMRSSAALPCRRPARCRSDTWRVGAGSGAWRDRFSA